jgi:hypothetical protein
MLNVKIIGYSETKDVEKVYSPYSEKIIELNPQNDTYRATLCLELPNGKKLKVKITKEELNEVISLFNQEQLHESQ